MDKHIDLIINRNKVHIPRNNNHISLDKLKSNISNSINTYNFNFNKDINQNEILDLLIFIQYYNVFKNNICDNCKKKINQCLE